MVGRRTAPPAPGVVVHRPRGLGWSDVRFRAGIPLTSPAQTLITLAATLEPDALEALCALAFRRGWSHAPPSWPAIDAHGHRPGLPALRPRRAIPR